uniref:histidine kinase n=2 Tax=Natrinema halophilum TaxID=1699371 RepID=A0A7D5GNL1_9EURY
MRDITGKIVSSDWIRGQYILYGGILLHFGIGLLHLSRHTHLGDFSQSIFEIVILIGFPSAMLAFLYWRRSDFVREKDFWRTAVGGGLGMATALTLYGLYLLDSSLSPGVSIELASLSDSTFTYLLAANGGALAGLLFGWQQIRVRQVARQAERAETRAELSKQHEQSLLFLNRILRHHVLNGLNVILVEVENLRLEDENDSERSLDTIEMRGKQMADYVEDIRSVVHTLSGEISEQNIELSATLEETLQSARHSFPTAEYEASIPAGITVRGTPLAGLVFENLLENAVRHNDSEIAKVRLDVDETDSTVRVTVADNGPGIPDDRKTAYFRRGEHGQDSLGEGLGLYLAETVVTLSGGDIWIEDNDPTGTRVIVELRKSSGESGEARNGTDTRRTMETEELPAND